MYECVQYEVSVTGNCLYGQNRKPNKNTKMVVMPTNEVAGSNDATGGINPVGYSGTCHRNPTPNIPKL